MNTAEFIFVMLEFEKLEQVYSISCLHIWYLIQNFEICDFDKIQNIVNAEQTNIPKTLCPVPHLSSPSFV